MSNFARSLRNGTSVVALTVAFGFPASAASLPSHGHYVSGQGSINKANRSLTVKQSSTTGIIDWKSFSIPRHDGVTFDNGGGATLNRVTGGNLSTIAGSLHATGSLYLINSSGMIVSGTGRVVTGGNFVASTGSITNEAFDERHVKFRQRGGGDIINRGSIAAGGNVRLSARDVTQSGSAAGSNVTLRAVNQLDISGTVAARHAGGAGATIIATGRHIDVAGTAHLSASGTQGGKVFLGGDIHGGRIASEDLAGKHVRDARTTVIAKGARISANAGDGDGGDIVIWSNGHTTFKGKVSATGKTAGGFAEVSSHELLGFGGRVDLLSHHGTTGTLLLDPENVVISDGTSSGDGFDGGSNPNTYTPPGPDSVLTVADLQTALASANVVVNTHGSDAQAGDIAVLSPLTWSANTLTLDAYGSLYVEAHVSATGTAGLTLIDADTTQTGVNDGNAADGDLFFDGGRISFANTSEALSINANAYILENSVGNLATAIAGNASGYYALADNYDASGDNSGSPYTAAPIPTTFTGTFEGLGNTISNLSINDSTDSDAVGLFAQISGGTVRDLALSKVDVESAGQFTQTGALAGDVKNGATIFNVSVSGNVSQTGRISDVGGLAGLVDASNIKNSRSAAAVDALGENVEGGGFVGLAIDANTFADDAATGAVTGGDDVDTLGGFAGILERGTTVTDSRATGDVAAGSDANLVGGFVGYMEFSGTTVERSYATGTVSAVSGGNLGGFIGLADENTTIETSYATGSVSGTSSAGGFVGENRGTIDQSYSTGAVMGGSGDVGGFAGVNQATATIDESYETGAARGGKGATVGGFVGENDNTLGATTAVYFNSNANSGPGVGTGTAIAQGGGLSRTAMQTASNFSGWTFGTTGGGSGWVIVDQDGSLNNASGAAGGTTPMLLSEYSTTIANAHQLQLMELDPTANYTLANDIDASATGSGGDVWGSQGFIGVGGNNSSGDFTGTFDGQGHFISSLFIDDTTNVYVGLFGVIGSGGVVENVIVGGVSNGTVVGGLAGLVATGGTVTGSASFATVSGSSAAGGLVGENDSTVSQSSAAGSVSGANYVGGLVGNNKGNVTYSYATGAVGGSGGELGGLVGNNDGLGSIDHSYATGAVTGGANSGVGGIVGYGAGSISYTYATGALSGTYIGGISGGGAGAISHSYWDVTSTGQTQSDWGNRESAATYGLSDADMRNPAKMADFLFGGIGSGADWVTVGADGSVDGTGGTTPMLLSEYSTTITNAHQLQMMALDPTANYTLANDIDASGTAGGDVWGSQGFIAVGGNGAANFTGTFDGAAHTISNLFIDDSTNTYVGLFGYVGAGGDVSEITLTNASVSGGTNTGALAGQNDGAISGAVAYGTVTGGTISATGGLVGNNTGTITQSGAGVAVSAGDSSFVGGFVGQNDGGTISQSWASGAVTGGADHSRAGGFVGQNATGSISQSYAAGNVSDGDDGDAGGFVGDNFATISQSYSLGVVSGGEDDTPVGGFAGADASIDGITGSYWDTDTSGTFSGFGQNINSGTNTPGITNLTSSQLQAALPSGFDSSVWGTGAGLFPYLKSQFAAGVTPVAISGTLSGGGSTVGVYGGGALTDLLSVYADGSFYALVASLPRSGLAVVHNDSFLFEDTGDHSTGINLGTPGLTAYTSDASLSALGAALLATLGNGSPLGTITSVQDVASATGGSVILNTTGNFDFDQNLNLGSKELTLNGDGDITQTVGGITAATIGGDKSSGDVTLNGANQIGAISVLVLGDGDLSLTTGTALSVDEALATNVTLTTTGAGNGMSFTSFNIVSGTMTLNSAGGISGSGIDAGTLTGSANGAVSLSGSITNLDGFSTGGDAFSFSNSGALDVTGAVNAGSGAVALTTASGNLKIENAVRGGAVTLTSAGTLSETGSGVIDATTLKGSSHGAVTLNGANVITDLGAFSTGGKSFSLKDDHDLTTTGTVNTGSGALTLTTTGSGHDIAIHSKLESTGTVKLASAATISENSAGAIDAKTLTGSSKGAVTLTSSKNVIADLGAFSTGGGAFSLKDDHDLTTTGTVNAGSHTVTLATTGSGHDIAVDSKLQGGEVKLASAATISESKAGDIDAKTLTGSAHGAVKLTSARNTVTDLGAFSAAAFAFTDDHALTVDGKVNAGTGTLDLTTVGKNHNLAIDAAMTGGTVNLVTTGKATESSSKGAITAKLLNVTADTGIELTSKHNKIKKLGKDKTKKGPNKVTL